MQSTTNSPLHRAELNCVVYFLPLGCMELKIVCMYKKKVSWQWSESQEGQFSDLTQSNKAIRNFLVALKLFLNAKNSLSLWSKWQIGHGKWFLNTNLFLIKPFLIAKFDCTLLIYAPNIFMDIFIDLWPCCFITHLHSAVQVRSL